MRDQFRIAGRLGRLSTALTAVAAVVLGASPAFAAAPRMTPMHCSPRAVPVRTADPPSSVLTIAAEAVAPHDVVGALRSGSLGTAFSRVGWVGHSSGSMDGITVAARYGNDLDALVVTGLLHGQSAEQGAAPAQLYPAIDDPKFPPRPEDGLTHRVNVPVLLVVGQRDALFYGAEWIDCDSPIAVRDREALTVDRAPTSRPW
jgi:hypothetical protein